MRSALLWSVLAVVAASLAGGLGAIPGSTAVALAALGAGTALVAGLLSRVTSGPPGRSHLMPGTPADGTAIGATSGRQAPADLPPGLDRLERLMILATATAGDVHFRFRPVVREVATELLLSGHGIDLDRDPAAEALLGPALWELVRPHRPPPAVRQDPGLDWLTVESLIAGLEALA